MIIGIHGLNNKPNKEQLIDWWIRSINEGMQRNKARKKPFSFDLAYWADTRYETPLIVAEMGEPYMPSPLAGSSPLERFRKSFFDKIRSNLNNHVGDMIDSVKDLFDLDDEVRKVFGLKLPDLSEYYRDVTLRNQIRKRLKETLLKHKSEKICLIAHSMGSLIAYDSLRELEHSSDLKIAHFITIGSPLGLPFITGQIRHKFGLKLKTPENVNRWTNIADPGDKVALDVNLADEYTSNSRGIQVKDMLVVNDYIGKSQEENPHKSYGYLRNPEMTDLIMEFLGGE